MPWRRGQGNRPEGHDQDRDQFHFARTWSLGFLLGCHPLLWRCARLFGGACPESRLLFAALGWGAPKDLAQARRYDISARDMRESRLLRGLLQHADIGPCLCDLRGDRRIIWKNVARTETVSLAHSSKPAVPVSRGQGDIPNLSAFPRLSADRFRCNDEGTLGIPELIWTPPLSESVWT